MGSGRETPSRRWLVAPLAVLCQCLLSSGCALPDYHLPQGFSSTYFRALQHQNAIKTAVENAVPPPGPQYVVPPVNPYAAGPPYVPQASDPAANWDRFRQSLSVPPGSTSAPGPELSPPALAPQSLPPAPRAEFAPSQLR